MTTRQPDPLPEATAQFALPDGRPVAVWYRWFWDVANMIPKIIAIIDNPPPEPEYELVEDWPVIIPYAENGSMKLILDAAAGREILETTSQCVSGSCTLRFKINSTNLGGSTNSASTSEQTQTHSSANVMVAGDNLVMEISSNSNCEGLEVNVKTKRVLTV